MTNTRFIEAFYIKICLPRAGAEKKISRAGARAEEKWLVFAYYIDKITLAEKHNFSGRPGAKWTC